MAMADIGIFGMSEAITINRSGETDFFWISVDLTSTLGRFLTITICDRRLIPMDVDWIQILN